MFKKNQIYKFLAISVCLLICNNAYPIKYIFKNCTDQNIWFGVTSLKPDETYTTLKWPSHLYYESMPREFVKFDLNNCSETKNTGKTKIKIFLVDDYKQELRMLNESDYKKYKKEIENTHESDYCVIQ